MSIVLMPDLAAIKVGCLLLVGIQIFMTCVL